MDVVIPTLLGHEQQLIPGIVCVSRLAGVRSALKKQLYDLMVSRSNRVVYGELIPVLRIREARVSVEKRPGRRQIAKSAGLEQGPSVEAVQRLDAINIGAGLHRFGLRNA